MALYREYCFLNCSLQNHGNKVTFVGFRGGSIATQLDQALPLALLIPNLKEYHNRKLMKLNK